MNKDQKTILQFYTAYIVAIICNIIPSSAVQTFGLILFIVIFIATYVLRGKSAKDSLIYNHMQFMIKSIWISSLILLMGMTAAYFIADHSIIYQTIESAKSGVFLTESQLNSILMDYMRANIFTFILTLTPSLIYLVYRFSKGVMYAKDGYVVPNLKNWF